MTVSCFLQVVCLVFFKCLVFLFSSCVCFLQCLCQMSPYISHSGKCLHAYILVCDACHMAVNVSMHVTWCQCLHVCHMEVNVSMHITRSHGKCLQCLHTYHTVVNVSMHVTWCQISPYISHSFSSYSRHRCHNVVLLLAFDIGIHSVHYLICYCSVCGLRQQHVLTRL